MKYFFSKPDKSENQKNYTDDAHSYSKIGLDSTMFLAYRDIPFILQKHLLSKETKKEYKLLDFGCGSGVSTKIISDFMKNIGLNVKVFGLDINEENLKIARKNVPEGTFSLIKKNNFSNDISEFDLIICNFVLLENNFAEMLTTLKEISKLMNNSAVLIVTNCTSHVYDKTKTWYSFQNDFLENSNQLKDGQVVKLEISDKKTQAKFVVTDFFHKASSYRLAYQKAGLELKETLKPTGKNTDGIPWSSEMKYPPYKIHVLYKKTESIELEENTTFNNVPRSKL